VKLLANNEQEDKGTGRGHCKSFGRIGQVYSQRLIGFLLVDNWNNGFESHLEHMYAFCLFCPVQVEVCSDEPIPRTRNPKKSTKNNSETRKAGGPVAQWSLNSYESSGNVCCSDGTVC
jgi:hypothetical protein